MDVSHTVYVYVEQLDTIAAVNTSGLLAGSMKVSAADGGGTVTNTPYGVVAMATYVAPVTGRTKLILLEKGGPGRYLELDLGNLTTPCHHCIDHARVDQVWQNISTCT